MTTQAQHESKTKLLDAALHVIRAKGYAATTVDDICRQAGVTKGSFFHHFKSKDELALAAASHFSAMAEGLFAVAPYHDAQDPLERLLGYVDFRAAILGGELPEYTCLLGTLVQETSRNAPGHPRSLRSRHVCPYCGADAGYRSRQETLCTGRTVERRERRLLHSIRFAGLVHLCEGKAKPRRRPRKPGAFAALSGVPIRSIA